MNALNGSWKFLYKNRHGNERSQLSTRSSHKTKSWSDNCSSNDIRKVEREHNKKVKIYRKRKNWQNYHKSFTGIKNFELG